MKIKGFVFSENYSEALVESLRTPRRVGMSGCRYGPFYGPVGQAWHITSGGRLESFLPILVGREGDSTRIPPREIKRITSPAIAAGMLMQISQIFGRDAAEDLLDTPLAVGFPLFKVYMYYEERNLGTHYGEPLRYIRPPWPGTPFLRWGDFEISVPRVGYDSVEFKHHAFSEEKVGDVAVHHCVDCGIVRIGKTRIYLAQPEGQGKVYYKVGRDFAPIIGGEILSGLRQEDCQIQGVPPEKEAWFIGLLIYRRLGDLLVVDEQEAEEFGLSKATELGSAELRLDDDKYIILLHPEHGLLRVKKDDKKYGIYKVPYITRPRD